MRVFCIGCACSQTIGSTAWRLLTLFCDSLLPHRVYLGRFGAKAYAHTKARHTAIRHRLATSSMVLVLEHAALTTQITSPSTRRPHQMRATVICSVEKLSTAHRCVCARACHTMLCTFMKCIRSSISLVSHTLLSTEREKKKREDRTLSHGEIDPTHLPNTHRERRTHTERETQRHTHTHTRLISADTMI